MNKTLKKMSLLFYFPFSPLCVSSMHVVAQPGGFLVQRSIRGRAAEMGLRISLLV